MDVHTQATRAFSLSLTRNVELHFAPVKFKKKKSHASGTGVLWRMILVSFGVIACLRTGSLFASSQRKRRKPLRGRQA